MNQPTNQPTHPPKPTNQPTNQPHTQPTHNHTTNTIHHHQQQQCFLTQGCPLFLLPTLVKPWRLIEIMADVERVQWSWYEAARAPSPLVTEARAADRARGSCRDLPPLLSTVSQPKFKVEWVGRGRAARRSTGTEHCKDQGGDALHVECQSGWRSDVIRFVQRRHRRVAACQSAEPPGPQERIQRHTAEQIIETFRARPISRCSCAADGGPADGCRHGSDVTSPQSCSRRVLPDDA